MSKLGLFVSANILFLCCAATASPLDQVPDAPQEKVEAPSGSLSEDLSISTPPRLASPPAPPAPEYYPYQQQLTFRFGWDGTKFENRVLGFQYLFPKFLSPKLEAGADLESGSNGHIHAGLRWIWWERSYFRPSLKVSADHFVNSSQGMATFSHYENYYLRNTATAEYVLWNPYSIRLEVELLLGFKNLEEEFTVGISRGW